MRTQSAERDESSLPLPTQTVEKERQHMKERRNKLGLTQEQVAECACISARSYKMYEAHQRKPNVYAALRLAQVLQTTVEELFAGGELYGT